MLQIFKYQYTHINVQFVVLRIMAAEVHVAGLSLPVLVTIIAAAVLVLAVFLLCCCYCCYCKSTGRHYQVSLESCDGCCLTIHLVYKKSVGRDLPVLQKRTLTSLPNNFHNFITATVIPSFEKQRLIGYQFAVVVFLSEKDFNNICDTTFVPSYGGQPLLDKYHPSMPKNAINYQAAHPSSDGCHSEEEIFGKYSSINSPFSRLWSAYMRRNGSPPKCVLLYSWNLPCSRCTDVIIRSLNEDTYSCTSVIVAHTTYWQRESEDEHRKNTEKLKKENITVVQVPYPERLSPASSI